MFGLDSFIVQPCHTVQYDQCNLPALRRAQRFPAGRTAEAIFHLRVRAGSDGQVHCRGSRGVPHTEVELVLLNGESVGFERVILDTNKSIKALVVPTDTLEMPIDMGRRST